MHALAVIALVVLALGIAVLVAGQLGLLTGTPPAKLGVTDGRLKPPSKTPNSVSSQADLYPDHPQRPFATIEPFKFTGSGETALAKIADLLQKSERTVVVTQAPDYVYAQCSTALLKFTDDIEFFLDRSQGVIHVRSASRIGRKDFNVNRKRVESIRVAVNL